MHPGNELVVDLWGVEGDSRYSWNDTSLKKESVVSRSSHEHKGISQNCCVACSCVQLINTSNMLHNFTREHGHMFDAISADGSVCCITRYITSPSRESQTLNLSIKTTGVSVDATELPVGNKPCEPRAWREVGSAPEMDRYGCACYCCQRC